METEILYKLFNVYLYKNKDSLVISDANPEGTKSSLLPYTTESDNSINPENIVSGSIAGNLEYTGGYIQSANFVAGTSGWKLDSSGTLTAVNATLSGTITATAGTIGGWTIGTTTISSATSGERIVLDQGNAKLSMFNSSGTEIVKMNYGSTGLQAIQKIEIKDNDKRGIEFIVQNTRGGGAKCITIDNPSTSICIDITDAGSTGMIIAGASSQGILLTHSGTSSALEINGAGNAPAILLTGGDYPCIDLSQNGTATNSFGIRIAQDSNALQDGIFINNDASSNVSWGINIDRDGATSGGIVAALNIECANATDGTKATGINFANATIYSIFNVATDATDPTGGGGAATGRIPILVSGALKYLAYY